MFFVKILTNAAPKWQNFMTPTIAEALKQAAQILQENNLSEPRRDAKLLLRAVLKKDNAFLLAHDDKKLSAAEAESFFSFIARRAKDEPVQQITGFQEFYGLEFEVNENVLIPRPETEILVEAAIEILKQQENKNFCDVGTGSGCIPIAILKNVENALATALDISPKALAVAQKNAEKHAVSERINFYESDLFGVFKNQKSKIQNSKFSVVVSNPPYIPNGDLPELPAEVREFEPHSALFGGDAGTEIIERLLIETPDFLTEKGFLLFEIGFGQGEKVREIIDEKTWELCHILEDLAGIPRIVMLRKI